MLVIDDLRCVIQQSLGERKHLNQEILMTVAILMLLKDFLRGKQSEKPGDYLRDNFDPIKVYSLCDIFANLLDQNDPKHLNDLFFRSMIVILGKDVNRVDYFLRRLDLIIKNGLLVVHQEVVDAGHITLNDPQAVHDAVKHFLE